MKSPSKREAKEEKRCCRQKKGVPLYITYRVKSYKISFCNLFKIELVDLFPATPLKNHAL